MNQTAPLEKLVLTLKSIIAPRTIKHSTTANIMPIIDNLHPLTQKRLNKIWATKGLLAA